MCAHLRASSYTKQQLLTDWQNVYEDIDFCLLLSLKSTSVLIGTLQLKQLFHSPTLSNSTIAITSIAATLSLRFVERHAGRRERCSLNIWPKKMIEG